MTEDGKSAWSTIGTRDTKKKNPMMRTKTPMQDEPKDLKYPSNSLYYSGPSKIIETHVTKKENMKDEQWVDSIKLSPIPYRDLDDEALEKVIKDVRREYERRQKERYDLAMRRKKQSNERVKDDD